jgi:hypothetical protein
MQATRLEIAFHVGGVVELIIHFPSAFNDPA